MAIRRQVRTRESSLSGGLPLSTSVGMDGGCLGERWDQLLARALDHLRRTLLRKRAEVLIQANAGVCADLVDESLAVPVEGARAPVRALEAPVALDGPFICLERAERGRHLLGSEVCAPGAVPSEVES